METQFNNNQFDFIYPDGIEKSFWTIVRNKEILDFIKRNKINNVLDIGCGRGIVTDYLNKNGIDVLGVELGIAKPMDYSTVDILYNTDACSLSDEKVKNVEALALFDVIEHNENPSEFLGKLLIRFSNVNKIIVTVPARAELWSNYDEFNGHYKRYSLDDMQDVFQSIDFKVVEKRYFFHSLYIFLRLIGIVKKKRNTEIKSPKGFGIIINKIIASTLMLERFIFPKCFYGTSIICVAERK